MQFLERNLIAPLSLQISKSLQCLREEGGQPGLVGTAGNASKPRWNGLCAVTRVFFKSPFVVFTRSPESLQPLAFLRHR